MKRFLARKSVRLATRIERIRHWTHYLALGWQITLMMMSALITFAVVTWLKWPESVDALERFQRSESLRDQINKIYILASLWAAVPVIAYGLARWLTNASDRVRNGLLRASRRLCPVNKNVWQAIEANYQPYFSLVAKEMHDGLLPDELRAAWHPQRIAVSASIDSDLLLPGRARVREGIAAGYDGAAFADGANPGFDHDPEMMLEFRDWFWDRYLLDGEEVRSPLLLRGQPGSGKSIQLYHLFGDIALQLRAAGDGWIPILIFAHEFTAKELNQAATMDGLMRWYFLGREKRALHPANDAGGIPANVEAESYKAAAALVEEHWSTRQFLVVIDGLDEMQDHAEHDQMLQILTQLILADEKRQGARHRYLLSCREDEDSSKIEAERVELLPVGWEAQRAHLKKLRRLIRRKRISDKASDGGHEVDRARQIDRLLAQMKVAEHYRLFRNYLSNPFFLYIITTCYTEDTTRVTDTLRKLFEYSLKRELGKPIKAHDQAHAAAGQRTAFRSEASGLFVKNDAHLFAFLKDVLGPFCFWRSFVNDQDSRTLQPEVQFELFGKALSRSLGIGRTLYANHVLQEYFKGSDKQREAAVEKLGRDLNEWSEEFVARFRGVLFDSARSTVRYDEFESQVTRYLWHTAIAQFEERRLGTVKAGAITKFRHRRMIELLATIALEDQPEAIDLVKDRVEDIWLRDPLRMAGALSKNPEQFLSVFLARWHRLQESITPQASLDLMRNASEVIAYLPRRAEPSDALSNSGALLGEVAIQFACEGGITAKYQTSDLKHRIEVVRLIYGSEFFHGLEQRKRTAIAGKTLSDFTVALFRFAMRQKRGPWEHAYRCLWSIRSVHPEVKPGIAGIYLLALRELLFDASYQYLVRETHHHTLGAASVVASVWAGGNLIVLGAICWLVWSWRDTATAGDWAITGGVGLLIFAFVVVLMQKKELMDVWDGLAKLKLWGWLGSFALQLLCRIFVRPATQIVGRHTDSVASMRGTGIGVGGAAAEDPTAVRNFMTKTVSAISRQPISSRPTQWNVTPPQLRKLSIALSMIAIYMAGAAAAWACYERYSLPVMIFLDERAAKQVIEDAKTQQVLGGELRQQGLTATANHDESTFDDFLRRTAEWTEDVGDLQSRMEKLNAGPAATTYKNELNRNSVLLGDLNRALRGLEMDIANQRLEQQQHARILLKAQNSVEVLRALAQRETEASSIPATQEFIKDIEARMSSAREIRLQLHRNSIDAKKAREALRTEIDRTVQVKVRALARLGRFLMAQEDASSNDDVRAELLDTARRWHSDVIATQREAGDVGQELHVLARNIVQMISRLTAQLKDRRTPDTTTRTVIPPQHEQKSAVPRRDAAAALHSTEWAVIKSDKTQLLKELGDRRTVLAKIKQRATSVGRHASVGTIDKWIKVCRSIGEMTQEIQAAGGRAQRYSDLLSSTRTLLQAENPTVFASDISALVGRESGLKDIQNEYAAAQQWVAGQRIDELQKTLAEEKAVAIRQAREEMKRWTGWASVLFGFVALLLAVASGSSLVGMRKLAKVNPAHGRRAYLDLLGQYLATKPRNLAFHRYAELAAIDLKKKQAQRTDIVREMTALKQKIRGFGHIARTLEAMIENYLELLVNEESRQFKGKRAT